MNSSVWGRFQCVQELEGVVGLFFVSDCVTASFMTIAKRKRNIFKSNRINSVWTLLLVKKYKLSRMQFVSGWKKGNMNLLHSTYRKIKCVFYNSNLLGCRHSDTSCSVRAWSRRSLHCTGRWSGRSHHQQVVQHEPNDDETQKAKGEK